MGQSRILWLDSRRMPLQKPVKRQRAGDGAKEELLLRLSDAHDDFGARAPRAASSDVTDRPRAPKQQRTSGPGQSGRRAAMDANEGSPTIEDVLPSNEEGGNGPPAGGALEEETLRLMQMSGNAVFEQARTIGLESLLVALCEDVATQILLLKDSAGDATVEAVDQVTSIEGMALLLLPLPALSMEGTDHWDTQRQLWDVGQSRIDPANFWCRFGMEDSSSGSMSSRNPFFYSGWATMEVQFLINEEMKWGGHGELYDTACKGGLAAAMGKLGETGWPALRRVMLLTLDNAAVAGCSEAIRVVCLG